MLSLSLALAAIPAAAGCEDAPRLRALDFWQGRWIVSAHGAFAGHDVVERVLDGCALTERWLAADGHAGLGLFWYDRETDRWKQVWVTDSALRAGGTKEKAEIREMTAPDRIRFQGRYPSGAEGRIVHDRTTLSREGADRVRQLIEISTDGGTTWKTAFDGEYRRVD